MTQASNLADSRGTADVSANGPSIDDVGFLTGVIDKLVTEIGIDPGRVFAAGSSRGGFMAFRLALEVPSRFRAVAAASANVHTPGYFKCKPAQNGTSSVMIMNGTEDPLVPFNGGEVSLFGFSYKYAGCSDDVEGGPAARSPTRPRMPSSSGFARPEVDANGAKRTRA